MTVKVKWVGIGLALLLPFAPPLWAEDDAAQSERQDGLRVKDLPTPIPELLHQLQALSQKIEPEITKLGSTLGQELDQTVRKLRRELEARRTASDQRTDDRPAPSP